MRNLIDLCEFGEYVVGFIVMMVVAFCRAVSGHRESGFVWVPEDGGRQEKLFVGGWRAGNGRRWWNRGLEECLAYWIKINK